MKKQHKFALSILTASLFAATSATAADTDSPFAAPLHLSNAGGQESRTITTVTKTDLTAEWSKTETNGSKWEKQIPNVMLYLDDSGSMGYTPSGGTYSPWGANSKAGILKRVLSSVLDKHGEKGNWGLEWLNRNATGSNLTDDYISVKNKANKLVPSGATPFLTGYVRAVDRFADTPIDLQCTNNFIIAMTDGAANKDTTSGLDSIIGSSSVWQKAGVYSYNLDGWEPHQFATGGGMPGGTWQNQLGWNSTETQRLDAKFLRQLSEPLEKNANIITYTVAFGLGNDRESIRTRNMLKDGASGINGQLSNGNQTYFEANDEKSLQDAFERMFKNISDTYVDTSNNPVVTRDDPVVTPPSVKPGTSMGATTVTKNIHALAAPALSGDNKLYPDELVALYLPIKDEGGLRSAELRFYETRNKYQYNDKGLMTGMENTDDLLYQTPDFTSRQAVISNRYGQTDLMSPIPNDLGFSNDSFRLDLDSTGNEWKDALFPWMSRSLSDIAIQELGYKSNTLYRDRKGYQMGDILESDIVTLRDTSVKSQPAKYIVAAANDGMAYVFEKDASVTNPSNQPFDTTKHPFKLQMTYAPSALLRQDDDTLANHYKDIAHEEYAKTTDHPHLYMLSGGLDGHTLNKPAHIDYVVGNAGRGAKGLYALNISALATHAQNDWKDAVPLFDAGAHRGGLESNMGYTIGYPSTYRFGNGVVQADGSLSLKTGIYVLSVVGSGFSTKTDLTKQETALYLYDTLGGADVGIQGDAKIDNKKAGTLVSKTVIGNTGGLATPTLVDINYDGVADYAFAGDYSGNMYRCDMRFIDITDAKNKNQVSCEKIFEGTADRPITSAPVIGQLGDEYVVVWGTGSDLFEADLIEKKRQAIYGVYQKFDLKTLDIQDDPTDPPNSGNPVVKESDLLKQTFSIAGKKADPDISLVYRNVSNEPISKAGSGDKRSYKGWILELDEKSGERIVTQPIIVGSTVFLTTRVYNEKGKDANELSAKPWNDSWKTPADWEPNGWTQEGLTQTINISQCSSKPEDKTSGKNGWSQAVLIDSQTTTSATSSVSRCNENSGGSRTSKTYTFQSKCTEETHTKTVVKPNAEITYNSSALIQLNVVNGGAINPKNSKNPYVLLNADEHRGSSTGFTGTGYIVTSEGYKGFISTSLTNPSDKGFDRNSNGNIAHHGVSHNLNEQPPKEPEPNDFARDNPCYPDDGKSKFQIHLSNTETGLETIDGFGQSPQINCLRRISWREIY